MRIPLDHLYRRALRFAAEVPATRWRRSIATNSASHAYPNEVVGILGATGTGKSNLSIELATRYPSEIINSDKIQVYRGLDITTNKHPLPDRRGIPHHLLGELDPLAGELSPSGFRSLASPRIESIRARGRLPIVAGGSNSFVHALLASDHVPGFDPFASGVETGPVELRYPCCLLWVDVKWDVLVQYLDRRVDEMVRMGMVEELEEHYQSARAVGGVYRGLETAIGVPEFDRFFLRYPPGRRRDVGSCGALVAAVEEIKENTRLLARRQLEKIRRLRCDMGWRLRRLDATEVVKVKMEGRDEVGETWEREVVAPAVEEVEAFLLRRREGVLVLEAEGVEVEAAAPMHRETKFTFLPFHDDRVVPEWQGEKEGKTQMGGVCGMA